MRPQSICDGPRPGRAQCLRFVVVLIPETHHRSDRRQQPPASIASRRRQSSPLLRSPRRQPSPSPTPSSGRLTYGDLTAPARRRRPPHPRQGEASPRPQLPTAGSWGDRRRSCCPKLPRSLCQAILPPANIGVGVQFHKGQRLTYNLRAKKALPFTSDGLLGLNLKARLLTDTEFNPRKRTGAVELAWTILDFRKGQDVRLKLGYELYGKVPYLQLRENNWTLNAYMDGKWDVRFDM